MGPNYTPLLVNKMTHFKSTILSYTSGLEIVGQRTAFGATDLSAAARFPAVRARRRRGRPDLKRPAIAVSDFLNLFLSFRFDFVFLLFTFTNTALRILGTGKQVLVEVEPSDTWMYEI